MSSLGGLGHREEQGVLPDIDDSDDTGGTDDTAPVAAQGAGPRWVDPDPELDLAPELDLDLELELDLDLDPVGVAMFDRLEQTSWVNEVVGRSLGYSAEELAAEPFAALTDPDAAQASVDRGDQMLARVLDGQIDRFAVEKRFIGKDGRSLRLALALSVVPDGQQGPDDGPLGTPDTDGPGGLHSGPRAVGLRSQLRVERVPAIVYVAEPGPNGRWFYVSPQIEAILGFSAQEWMADPGLWLQQLDPQDRTSALAEEERLLADAGAEDMVYSQTYRLRHRNGTIVWVRDDATILWDQQGRATWHGVLVDVTREKRLQERLEHQTFHDPLTALPNRRLFHDRVDHALSRRHSGQVAVLFIDLDNFKTVNDSFGHACGDEVIVAAARRLQTCARAGDTAARLGGDEFALLVEDVSTAAVTALADRVLQALSDTPVTFNGRTLPIGASVGIAVAGPGESTQTLLRNADLAMYEAKLQGRSRHVLYEPTMHATVVNRFRLQAALHTAFDAGAITLAYQPIVDLGTGAVLGVEALARWSDGPAGDVAPSQFIPVAEQTGMIHELGLWAIEQACHDLRDWRSAHGAGAYVSVNVSPLQLDNDQFASQVVAILGKQDLAPSALVLEVTEGVLRVERSRQCLRELRSHGVRVAIDNFGTGYSSLSYLRQLPVDIVKIDRTFLGPAQDDRPDPDFLRAIIALARTLHLATICEGVQTHDQLAELRAAGCGYGQGNLLAKPGPLADIPATISVPTGPPAHPSCETTQTIPTIPTIQSIQADDSAALAGLARTPVVGVKASPAAGRRSARDVPTGLPTPGLASRPPRVPSGREGVHGR
jgi:diguanylate cyclase (GGDEF)-like protein/PAS domain S-box-containing protein